MIKEGLKKLKERNFADALVIFKKIIKSNPSDGDSLFCLGNIYYELNDLKKSLYYFERSLKKYPNSEGIINNYATALQSFGEIQKARELFSNLLKLNPDNIKVYYRLFRLNLENFNENYLEKLRSLDKNEKISLDNKALINFIFSKNAQNKNENNNEIYFLKKAHFYHFKYKLNYNSKLVTFYKNILGENFNKISFINSKNGTKYIDNKNPIFIIGLPRSGSTLIESLLSHSEGNYYSYGESGTFDTFMLSQFKKGFLKNQQFNIVVNEEVLVETIAKFYSYSKEKNFIDKSLENFFYIDVILKLYPKAKFIHTYRNRLDAAIAIYQSMLIHVPWAHSIKNILEYILIYEKIMKFFKNKYPDKIIDIQLEKFTSDPKAFAKKIYNFCDLTWDNDKINFYNSKNLMSKTSSFLQVRNKIKKSIKNKYRPYYYLIEKENIDFS